MLSFSWLLVLPEVPGLLMAPLQSLPLGLHGIFHQLLYQPTCIFFFRKPILALDHTPALAELPENGPLMGDGQFLEVGGRTRERERENGGDR